MAYRKRKTFKKKAFKRRSYAPKKKALRRMIRKVISRTSETKSKQMFLANKPLYSFNNLNFPNNVILLGPNSLNMPVSQGTGAGERIGNRITTKKLLFKGVLTPLPYNATSNQQPRPVQVKMVIFYDRDDPNTTPVPSSTFFQSGSSSDGFTGTNMDFLRPYNTDRYRIMKQRTFKLGFSQFAGSTTVPGQQADYQAYSNNDFKYNCNFSVDVTKYYPKQVKFNDNLSDPMTRGVYALFYYVNADGSIPASTNVPLMINYMQDYQYSDA